MNETMDSSKELVTFSFVTSAKKQQQQQRSNYVHLKNELLTGCYRENACFQRGLLMESVEKGVTYPIVHRGSIQNYFQKETEDRNRNYVITKGCYQEVEKVGVDLFGSALDDLLTGAGRDVEAWGRFFVVLGFKQLPSVGRTEVLESHWKDWTGARYLYLHLPDDFGPVKITFYKRFTPDALDLFLYMVVVECIRVLPSDVTPLKDFVQRMRADKMPFYLALYEDVRRSEVSRWSSSGESADLGSQESASSDEASVVSPRMTSTPIFGSPVAAFQSRVTFVQF